MSSLQSSSLIIFWLVFFLLPPTPFFQFPHVISGLVCLSLLFLAASVFAYFCFTCRLCAIFAIFFECFLLLSLVSKIYFQYLMLQFGCFFLLTSAVYLFVSVLGLVSPSLYLGRLIYTKEIQTKTKK